MAEVIATFEHKGVTVKHLKYRKQQGYTVWKGETFLDRYMAQTKDKLDAWLRQWQPPAVLQKWCPTCEKMLPRSRFWKQTSNPDGLKYVCGKCLHAKAKERAEEKALAEIDYEYERRREAPRKGCDVCPDLARCRVAVRFDVGLWIGCEYPDEESIQISALYIPLERVRKLAEEQG